MKVKLTDGSQLNLNEVRRFKRWKKVEDGVEVKLDYDMPTVYYGEDARRITEVAGLVQKLVAEQWLLNPGGGTVPQAHHGLGLQH
jgi:hypothetical protein